MPLLQNCHGISADNWLSFLPQVLKERQQPEQQLLLTLLLVKLNIQREQPNINTTLSIPWSC